MKAPWVYHLWLQIHHLWADDKNPCGVFSDCQAIGILSYCAAEAHHCPRKRQLHHDSPPNERWRSLRTTAACPLAWHTVRWQKEVRRDSEFRLPPSFIHPPPSAALPLLPVSPSGSHELQGFQAQILRFQMFGKFFSLSHCSRVRGFGLEEKN